MVLLPGTVTDFQHFARPLMFVLAGGGGHNRCFSKKHFVTFPDVRTLLAEVWK